MKRAALALLLLPLVLAACAEDRLTPAPGEAPGWPSQSPPRPSYAPLPFTTNYAPASPTQTQAPVPAGETVPYAVRGGQAAPAGNADAAIQWNQPGTAAQNCHSVPPVMVDGRQADIVCQQADGTWVYVAR